LKSVMVVLRANVKSNSYTNVTVDEDSFSS
jgi:hypothetical protein